MKRTIVLGIACSLIVTEARAQTACGGAEAKLDAIHEILRHQAARAFTWKWSWVGIGFGLSAAGWAQYPLVDSDKRLPQAVTATAPLFIVGQTLFFGLRAPGAFDELEADATTDPCAKLAHAEKLLEETADDEAEHTGVVAHVLSLTLSAAYMAGLAIAFKDPRYTFVDGGGSFVIGEAQILTTPTGARAALEKYRAGDLEGAKGSAFTWSIAPVGMGIGLVGAF